MRAGGQTCGYRKQLRACYYDVSANTCIYAGVVGVEGDDLKKKVRDFLVSEGDALVKDWWVVRAFFFKAY